MAGRESAGAFRDLTALTSSHQELRNKSTAFSELLHAVVDHDGHYSQISALQRAQHPTTSPRPARMLAVVFVAFSSHPPGKQHLELVDRLFA